MKLLDERGIGTVWSICKEKFALVGHTHNYAGSGSPGGSANSAIGVVDYNQTGKTIQIGYSGTGITGDQIKHIAGYTDGSGNVNAKIKDVSKDALKSWLGLGSLAYSSSSIPTKLSQLNNDKGFVTGSVSGNTVTINGASTTWTNTWRGIQDNLTSSSTSDSLSANQGKVLKGLIDSKADSSDLSSYYAQKSDAIKNISIEKMSGLNTQLFIQTIRANDVMDTFPIYRVDDETDGLMSVEDKVKLDGIASGANNYTLPVASQTTLGGIKVGYGGTLTGYNFPVELDDEGNAVANINGLFAISGVLKSINFIDGNISTKYDVNSIYHDTPSGNIKFGFPSESGTLALTSDIPNVSNLCRFNFVNSISECKSDRINFLFRCKESNIDLAPFDDYPDGTILLITGTADSTVIRHSSGDWFNSGYKVGATNTDYMSTENIKLITKYGGKVHYYNL